MKLTSILIMAIALTGLGGFSFWQTQSNAETERLITAGADTQQTQKFAVENMTCATCPITVRKAMEKVKGVTKVVVDFDNKIATAVFDPAVTTADAIAAASTSAGYPAQALESDDS